MNTKHRDRGGGRSPRLCPAAADAEGAPGRSGGVDVGDAGSGSGGRQHDRPGQRLVRHGPECAVCCVSTGRPGVTTFAEGLPPQVLGIGGAMDVASSVAPRTCSSRWSAATSSTATTSVMTSSGSTVSKRRQLHGDRRHRCLVDQYPPETDYFLTTGVQYALQRYGRGFLVTDGHHNRVLRAEWTARSRS